MAAFLSLLMPGMPATAAPDADRGLTSVTLPAPAGKLTVYLPSDMAAGDTISGTVVAEPAGTSEAERRKNSDTLSGYVIEIDRKPLAVKGGHFRYVAPAAGLATIGLLRSHGSRRPLVGTKVLIGPRQDPAAGPIELPKLGQNGRPVTIHGPFDGDLANTQVTIGGRPAELLAESPRAAVLRCPQEPLGATAIDVQEGHQRAQGPFHNLELRLVAPKTALQQGETTTLDAHIGGLQPRTRPLIDTEILELRLVAEGPIQLQGGNVQAVPIEPSQVGADGALTISREVRGVAPGTFNVQGTLQAGAVIRDDPLVPGAIDMNGIDGYKDLLVLLSALNDEERERRLQATLKALRQRHAEATDQGMKDWLAEKMRIVEKAMATLGYDR